jgi:hypothetical protein
VGGVVDLAVVVEDGAANAALNRLIFADFVPRKRLEWSVEDANRDAAGDRVDAVRRPGVPGKAQAVGVFDSDKVVVHLSLLCGRIVTVVAGIGRWGTETYPETKSWD